MKTRMRVAAAILAGAGIIAAGGGGAALASSGTPAITHATVSTQAPSAKTPKYVVLDCSFKPVVAPSTFVIACGDGGIGVGTCTGRAGRRSWPAATAPSGRTTARRTAPTVTSITTRRWKCYGEAPR